MVKEQVDKCLSELGEVPQVWTPMTDKLHHIALTADNNLFITPKRSQYYFDSVNSLLFIRYTQGDPVPFPSGTPPVGSVIVSNNGKPYLMTLEKLGHENAEIGRFHALMGYENIASFNKPKRKKY